MAYKSKKKNKSYISNLRKTKGDLRKKHEREKKRNHPEFSQKITLAYLEQKMREQGLI